MPTISFSIGGEEHDISNKSSKEVLDMVKTEYKKKNKEWKGRLGCYCYDCWKWCNKGSKEEWDTFFKKKFNNL